MAARVCTVEGCGERHAARGYCSRHYARFRAHGDAGAALRPGGRVTEDRLQEFRAQYEAERLEAGVDPGMCFCGCGEVAPVASNTNLPGRRYKGHPFRYAGGHHNRGRTVHPIVEGDLRGVYDEEDRGHDTPCWIWRGQPNREGYGTCVMTRGEYGTRLAHRAVYALLVEPVEPGRPLDHLCRVPMCVNPDHLEPVTNATNVQRGLLARLTLAQVEEIRAAHARGGRSLRSLGAEYGVAHTTIGKIVSGAAWSETASSSSRLAPPIKRLDWEKVEEIRRLAEEEGVGCVPLARMFGVTQGHVSKILNNEKWIVGDGTRTWGRRGLSYAQETERAAS